MNRPFTSILGKLLKLRRSDPEVFLVFQQHPESSDAPLVAVTRTEFDARAIEKQQRGIRPTYRVTWERFTVPDIPDLGDDDQLFIVFQGKRTRLSPISADRNPAPLGVFATEQAAREVKGAKYLRTVTVGWQDLSVWDHLD